MEQKSLVKRIIAYAVVILLIANFIMHASFSEIDSMLRYVGGANVQQEEADEADALDASYLEQFRLKQLLIDVNGYLTKFLGKREVMGMYITDDARILSAYDETSTDYEYEQTVDFYAFLKANDIRFLYVNEPIKYLDDAAFTERFGAETYSNQNADLLLTRLRDADVPVLDLREELLSDGKDIGEMFYRTDHHWNVPAGLWASQQMAEGLNTYCGYDIDVSIYEPSNYEVTTYEDCWLGEQGRKVGRTRVGLEDYQMLAPKFATDFSFKSGTQVAYQGTFDAFLRPEICNAENDIYESESWHYAYSRINCINNQVGRGKILFLCDSYDQVTEPFLALGVHEMDSVILRDCGDEFPLRDYILEQGYDTVLVAYTQFMIGAHDDETSSNYRMFTFE